MAEKGGKGFSLSKGRKSALKTPVAKGASAKGKDSNSSKKDRKVQFDTSSDSEGSPKTNNNASSKSGGKGLFESSGAKGGKAGKSGKAFGRSNAPKVPTAPELKIEEELPKNAKCLMDCEAEVVLQGIHEQLVILSKDPTIKLPPAFNKGLQYAKGSSQYTSPQSVRQALEKLRVLKISESEICLIANVCPETVDEVYALIPSLKPNRLMTEGAIKDVLYELDNLKNPNCTEL
ncbi:RNA polymerase II [Macleaya cordata]|uniref:RNA polymerase II n=1 Tax=Macleaya cordata TaxID=56857 RepID=A0A200Q3T6_MACCD|nr:RNA polymerase II [Macleaya cordata]